MALRDILNAYASHPQVRKLRASLRAGARTLYINGLHGSAPALVTALVGADAPVTLVLLNDDEEAGYFYHDLAALLPPERVFFFPSAYRRAAKYAQRDAAGEVLRAEVVSKISTHTQAPLPSPQGGKPQLPLNVRNAVSPLGGTEGGPVGSCIFLVTHPAALAERVAAPDAMQASTITLRTAETHDLTELERRLFEVGFRRKDYVYEPGEFAVRGSILDVYSYTMDYPVRIDFFGDEVDSIRTFDVQTQLSREQLKEVSLVADVEQMQTDMVPFADYLPADTLLVCRNLSYAREVIDKIYTDGFSPKAAQAAEEEAAAPDASPANWDKTRLLANGDAAIGGLEKLRKIVLKAEPLSQSSQAPLPSPQGGKPQLPLNVRNAVSPLGGTEGGPGSGWSGPSFLTTPQPLFHKNFDLLRDTLSRLTAEGYTLYVCADSEKQLERLKDIIQTQAPLPSPQGGKPQLPLNVRNAASPLGGTEGGPGHFTFLSPTLHAGFIDEELRIAVFTDHQIFDRYHKYNLRSERTRNAKMALTLKELMQFQHGDYIVHLDHGIGRFAGLVRVPSADGTMQEMVKLTYQHEDVVLVSIHALHKLSKYKGKDGEPPRLSRLGTGAWERMKERTKSRLKDIAADLIRLYADRQQQEGFAFSADSFLQQELEASFRYEDTPDQLRVTQEVKHDMESRRPMDRLVCGDVGFGKTEIAVRAALKAAVDNKQVAVLVPTTVLALQHYKTFCERLRDFPVKVDYLTRARTPKQVKELLAGLADGSINIVVGTHKLIGKNVVFKDLGLLIIDEEQKFGVSVKEKLRQMKTNVDTLTMSATPIPRTLQFSMMGARDFSVIETPPPNRRPIQTEIHTFSHEIIAEAVNFELSRNGQVFIVTNRINALENLRRLLAQYVPDARVAIGHGQMPPTELEEIVTDFINHDYDVLVSTTIVENGIDIPNANTIIIDAAHRFGLSDLHQMRGRVGRLNRKAFCYLLAPPLSLLPDDARRRLQAIEQFSDLGSGIHIAMQDLDIRGAGNLLGAEQSGFIADLGYETYLKILKEAVAEVAAAPLPSPQGGTLQSGNDRAGLQAPPSGGVEGADIECDLNAYLPETYVPGASERMMLYRELDSLVSPLGGTEGGPSSFRTRLEDRFGPLPEEAEELLRIVEVRALASRLGIVRLALKQGRMTLYFIDDAQHPFYSSQAFNRIIDYALANFRTCKLYEDNHRRRMTIRPVTSVRQALRILQDIAK